MSGCFVFVHTGNDSHRLSHLESLHFDTWIVGVEDISYPGTFAYGWFSPAYGSRRASCAVCIVRALDGVDADIESTISAVERV